MQPRWDWICQAWNINTGRITGVKDVEGRYAPMMDGQVGVLMDIHWERHLVHNMDMREAPLVICQVEKLRVHHWESLLVHNL